MIPSPAQGITRAELTRSSEREARPTVAAKTSPPTARFCARGFDRGRVSATSAAASYPLIHRHPPTTIRRI